MPRHAFRPNGGPRPFEVCFARWITKERRPSNPVYRSFIASFDTTPYIARFLKKTPGFLFVKAQGWLVLK